MLTYSLPEDDLDRVVRHYSERVKSGGLTLHDAENTATVEYKGRTFYQMVLSFPPAYVDKCCIPNPFAMFIFNQIVYGFAMYFTRKADRDRLVEQLKTFSNNTNNNNNKSGSKRGKIL